MTLVREKFSDAMLRSLKAPERGQTDYADGLTPGLIIRVGKRTKTFMFTRVRGGKRERITLGHYNPPHFTLAMAREKARELSAKTTLTEKPSSSFQECLEEFLAIKRQGNRLNTIRQTERHLRKHFPFDCDVTQIDAKMLAKKLDAIKAPVERRNAFAALRTFFNWLARQRRIPFSPVMALEAPLKPESRERVLGDAELASVWLHANSGVYGDVVRLCILTGQRIGQFAYFEPAYLAEGQIVWPGSAMKAGKRHTIPLTPTVATILATFKAPRRIRDRDKKKLDRRANVYHWTHHDLRRTLATKMAEIGIAPHVVERILAHQTGTISGVAAIYNRHHFMPEMKSALLAYEEKLQALIANYEATREQLNPLRDPSLHHEAA